MSECNADNWREVLEAECGIPADGWTLIQHMSVPACMRHGDGWEVHLNPRWGDPPYQVECYAGPGQPFSAQIEPPEGSDWSDVPRLVKALQAGEAAVRAVLEGATVRIQGRAPWFHGTDELLG